MLGSLLVSVGQSADFVVHSVAVVVSGQSGGTGGRQRPSVATCATVTREAGGDQGRWLFGHSDALSLISDRQSGVWLRKRQQAGRFTYGRGMREYRDNRVLRTESEYPNIVELAVARDGLATELSRQIIAFHKSRHIELRHGRITLRHGQIYYRWCFSDLATAHAFLERFGGAVVR